MQAVTMLAPLFAPVFGSYVAAWLGWRPLSGVLALQTADTPDGVLT